MLEGMWIIEGSGKCRWKVIVLLNARMISVDSIKSGCSEEVEAEQSRLHGLDHGYQETHVASWMVLS